ncbi:hypothetical protein ABE871_10545 [Enterococcus gilvus]|uniref:hypothetical protein n=1 Tax=Enterococcus gilvus TaxID=160453 RepID=UPI003D6BB00A
MATENELQIQEDEDTEISLFASITVSLESLYFQFKNFEGHANGELSTLKSRVNGLQGWINEHNKWAGNLSNKVSGIQNWINEHNKWASNLNSRVSTIANDHWNRMNRIDSTINNVANHASYERGIAWDRMNRIDDNVSYVANHASSERGKAWTRMNKIDDRITKAVKHASSERGKAWTRMNKIDERVSHASSERGKAWTRMNKIDDRITKVAKHASSERGKAWTRMNKIDERVDHASSERGKAWTRMNKIDDRITKVANHASSERGKAWDRMNKIDGRVSKNSDSISILIAANIAQGIWNKNQSNRIDNLEESDNEIRNMLKSEREERFSKDKELSEELVKESEDRKAIDSLISLKLISIDESIVKLNKRIDDLTFDFSDIGIIASIVSLRQSNENLWNADNYDGGSVGKNDGKAVRLFKNQFQGLKTHYAAIMRNYFDMDDKGSAIYRLRYSIVAGFEETKDLLIEWFTLILNSSNTTNSHLNSINTWLELQNKQFKEFYEVYVIITKWLEQIYKKPPPVVNVTVPEVTLSENGNGWLKTLIETVGSVIETAIETLGSLLETAIGEVGQLLRDLLAFLDGLIDDLLHLIVPENLDFMDHKYDSTSKTIKLKFSFIFDGIDSFKGMFGSKAVFKDIEMNLGSFGKGSFKLPVSMLNEMAPYVKALITGAVALEFLIDMYKWFHTRGEVIE